MCPAHHSHPVHSQSSPVTCDHHDGTALSQCAFSCCQDTSHPLTTTAIFVMPDAPALSEPAAASATALALHPSESLPSFAPPSPPPRS